MDQPGYKAHVFICTNQKEGSKECCAPKGAAELHAAVKEAAKAKYGKDVRINKSGCLDQCTRGIAAVIYPQNEWLLDLQKDDSEKVLAALDRAVQES